MENIHRLIGFMGLLAVALIIAMAEGCGSHQPPSPSNYRYSFKEQVPDSLRDDMANFITETMRASDQNLHTSDYEDVDDVVEEVTYSAEKIYKIPVEGLEYNDPNDDFGNYWKFIPYNQLSAKQKLIFNSLKENQQ